MIIAGAKGFAKEVLEVLVQLNYDYNKIAFFDNINKVIPEKLFGSFKVLRCEDDIIEFKNDNSDFTLGVGNPIIRYKMYELLNGYGLKLKSVISPKSSIGHFNVEIGEGINLMTGSIITNDIKIGKAALINLNCTIGHDSDLGDFVELSPGVHVSGNCTIGNFCSLGTNSTLLPGVTLGKNVIVGAGSVVTKDIPENSLVIGIPGKIIKELIPIGY